MTNTKGLIISCFHALFIVLRFSRVYWKYTVQYELWVQFYFLLPNITLIKDLLKNFYFEHEKAIISMYRYVIIILPNLTLFKLFKLFILCYLSFYWILWNIFKLFIKFSERLLNNWKSWTYFIHLLA